MIEKADPHGNIPGRLFSNSAFLVANDILTRGSTFILYALVARYLGAYQFGQLSLALTVLFTFQIIAPAGLRLFITREIADDLTKTNLYLVNGSLIAFLFSVLSYVVLLVLIATLNYSRDTNTAIFLVSLGLLPFSLTTICEAIFQGWERMQYITYANLPRNLGVIGITFLLLLQGHEISSIAWTLSISYWFLLAIEWWVIVRYISRPPFIVDLRFSVETTKKSMAFLGFQGTLVISNTAIVIMLSKFCSETEVGYYNAANQVMMPMMVIIQNIVLSAFPLMCRRFDLSARGLKLVSDNLIELLIIITLPIVIGLVFLSEDILFLLYGNEDFISAAEVLRLMLLTLILRAVSSVLGRDLLAGHREKAVLHIVLVSSVMNVISGLFLIRQFGLLGTAITTVTFAIISLVLHYIYISGLFSSPIPWQRLWKPLVATGILIVFLTFIKITPTFFAVIMGGLVYGAVWLLLNIRSAGNFSQLKLKYQRLWFER